MQQETGGGTLLFGGRALSLHTEIGEKELFW
jgi:hypothetical protein